MHLSEDTESLYFKWAALLPNVAGMSTEETLPKSEDASERKSLVEALRLLQGDAKAKGTDKMTMKEIIEEIAAYRREKQEQEKAGK